MNKLIYAGLGLAKLCDSAVKMNNFIKKMWEVQEYTGKAVFKAKIH